MNYKSAAEFIVRQVGTIAEPRFVLILTDELSIDITHEDPVQVNNLVKSWLKSPYIASSRSYPSRNIRPDWHPVVMYCRVPCIPKYDISDKVRDQVRIIDLI